MFVVDLLYLVSIAYIPHQGDLSFSFPLFLMWEIKILFWKLLVFVWNTDSLLPWKLKRFIWLEKIKLSCSSYTLYGLSFLSTGSHLTSDNKIPFIDFSILSFYHPFQNTIKEKACTQIIFTMISSSILIVRKNLPWEMLSSPTFALPVIM